MKQNVTKDSGQSPQVIIKSTNQQPPESQDNVPPASTQNRANLHWNQNKPRKYKKKLNLLALPFDDELQQSREW